MNGIVKLALTLCMLSTVILAYALYHQDAELRATKNSLANARRSYARLEQHIEQLDNSVRRSTTATDELKTAAALQVLRTKMMDLRSAVLFDPNSELQVIKSCAWRGPVAVHYLEPEALWGPVERDVLPGVTCPTPPERPATITVTARAREANVRAFVNVYTLSDDPRAKRRFRVFAEAGVLESHATARTPGATAKAVLPTFAPSYGAVEALVYAGCDGPQTDDEDAVGPERCTIDLTVDIAAQ